MHCGTNKKRMKKVMGGHVKTVDGITDGNAAARREYMKGGQVHYAHGEMPKAKAN